MHTVLLRHQKNDIFSIITKANLDPSEFEWKEVNSKWPNNGSKKVALLSHKPTDFYFAFDCYDNNAYTRYFPSDSTATEVVNSSNTWTQVAGEVSKWVSFVRREHLEPDLWELSHHDRRLVAQQIDEIENEMFTSREQQKISSAVREIREFLFKTSCHSEAHQLFIAARLQHLEEASCRLGRKDWITLAMGTLTNIVVGVALAPDAARELLRVAGGLLGWVMGDVHLIADAASMG